MEQIQDIEDRFTKAQRMAKASGGTAVGNTIEPLKAIEHTASMPYAGSADRIDTVDRVVHQTSEFRANLPA